MGKRSGAIRAALVVAAWAAACQPEQKARRLVSPGYEGHPAPIAVDTSPLRGHRILIDPGHGGRFPGAEGQAGTHEADVNLGVGLYLWGLLRDAGADVHLTRHSDKDLLPGPNAGLRDDLAARVHAIDSLAPEVFLSLHHNSNAALDRERNAIETYYKLDDGGPSWDLGRAIHGRLVQRIGIETAALRPGNYFVLRQAQSPAVLGEASYLSNPGVESKLELAEKQRLEAEAYFLGLVDFFAHGSEAVAKVSPRGDTLELGSPLRFTVAEPIDPLSAELELDGALLHVHADGVAGTISSEGDLPPGPHEVRARARLARGNAARPWSGRIVVRALPAHALVAQEPSRSAPGSAVRLRIAIEDAAGRSVGDGLGVRLATVGGTVIAAEDTTRAGEVVAIVRASTPAARVQVEAGSLREELRLRVEPGAPPARFARCVDAVSGAGLDHAWIEGGTGASDRIGWLELGAPSDTLRIERDGYVPWRGRVPADSVLRLSPLFGGRLRGVRVVLDAAATDATTPDGGAAAASAAYEACAFARSLLVAAGASCTLAVDRDEPASDLERLRRTLRARADWFVRLELGAPAASVASYPGSADGDRMARSLATWIARRRGGTVPVRTDTRFLLQQTPCPAVLVLLPAAESGPDAARELAYALFLGVRGAIDAESSQRPPLAGEIVPAPAGPGLVSLDGAEVLPIARNGRFRFECVGPGPHVLRVHALPPAEVEVQVAGNDTTRVRIARAHP